MSVLHTTRNNRLLSLWKMLGPGFITGASDDDPSGIGTYAIAGASFGFATLWTALVTFPMMAAVQFICAKIGMVAGEGLGSVLRKNFPLKVVYPAVVALLVANTINAGADIGAIAAAFNLLVPIPVDILIVPIIIPRMRKIMLRQVPTGRIHRADLPNITAQSGKRNRIVAENQMSEHHIFGQRRMHAI